MSRGQIMSVMGLYNYNEHLFDSMNFPVGFSASDKQTTINNIVVECAELELLYPSWDMMKTVIGLWSALELPVWQRIYNASKLEYNPIENYNRTEIETLTHAGTEEHSGTDTTSSSGTDSKTGSTSNNETASGTESTNKNISGTETNTGTDTTTYRDSKTTENTGTDTTSYSDNKTTTNSGTDTTTNSVTSYDSNSLYVHDTSALQHGHSTTENTTGSNNLSHGLKTTETISGNNTLEHGKNVATAETETDSTTRQQTINNSGSNSESGSFDKTDSLTHGEAIERNATDTKESHISGNIGVTTSQQMLEQELEISVKLNVMKIITESFKNRFCILVY